MYCPTCGQSALQAINEKCWQCSRCAFEVYLNVAATVAVIIEADGQLLFCQRGREPNKGLLDFAGGFMEHNETPEQALRREVLEELNIELPALSYLCALPSAYLYKSVQYATLDLYHYCVLNSKPTLTVGDDVADIFWIPRHAIPWDKLAHDSVKMATKTYMAL